MRELTSEEVRVLKELAQGKTTNEISALLSCSEPTTKRLIQRVRDQLGANNRTHAVYIAAKRGLI